MHRSFRHPKDARPLRRAHPGVLRAVRHLALAGLAMVLVWPAARGHSSWLGWMPMWLVGMPTVAWWALLGLPVPRWPRQRVQARRRRRVPGVQRQHAVGLRSPMAATGPGPVRPT